MKRALTLTLLLAFGIQISQGQTLEPQHRNTVEAFIKLIKDRNLEVLKTKVSYPLKREQPLPDVKYPSNFASRFDNIFDEGFIAKIVASDIDRDWSAMGWRGLMFDNGQLWLDYDGNLISVNYQSPEEQRMKKLLMQDNKASLHESIRDFQEPMVVIETRKFRVRIDKLADGSFRYASWNVNAPNNAKPDLILQNGQRHFEGSGGNHWYGFRSGDFKYEIWINVLGASETPPANLYVYQREKRIVNHDAQIVRD